MYSSLHFVSSCGLDKIQSGSYCNDYLCDNICVCVFVCACVGALPVEVLRGEALVGADDALSDEALLHIAERVPPQHLQPVQQLRNTHAVRRTQYKSLTNKVTISETKCSVQWCKNLQNV